MPVNRRRVELNTRRGPQGVTRGVRNPMIETAASNARDLAQRAAQLGGVMAQEAQAKGEALATAAALKVGPNGMPQLPPNATAEMGRIAQKSYDANMETRYLNQVQVMIDTVMTQAESESLYDPAAFGQTAQGLLGEMMQDVPEQYRGVVQQMGDASIAKTGAGIGRRQRQVADETASASYAPMSERWRDNAVSLIHTGDAAGAYQLVAQAIETIEAAPDYHLNPLQKQQMIEGLVWRVATEELIADKDVLNMTQSELSGMVTSLLAGNDPELDDYFTRHDTGQPSIDMRERAANFLRQFYENANTNGARLKAAADKAALRDDIAKGYSGGGTVKEQNELDEMLSEELGPMTEAGTRAPIKPTDWLTMDGQTRVDAMNRMKTAGFLPTSLIKLFRTTSRDNHDQMAALYDIYQDLKYAPNVDGKSVDMTSSLDERSLKLFEMVDAMSGGGAGGSVGAEEIAHVIETFRATEGRQADQQFLARAWNEGAGRWGGNGRVEPDDLDSAIRSELGRGIFDGIDVTDETMSSAVSAVKFYLASNLSREDAVKAAGQVMKGRYTETRFMGNGVSHSEWAPERHYAAPGATSFGGAVEEIGRWAGQNGVAVLDGMARLNSNLLTSGLYPKDISFDLEGLGPNMRPFEFAIEGAIRERVKGDAEHFFKPDWLTAVSGGDPMPNRMLRAGEDYYLVPDKAKGLPPQYVAMVKNRRGVWESVGRIDIDDKMQEWNEAAMTAERLARVGHTRIKQKAWEDVNRADRAELERVLGIPAETIEKNWSWYQMIFRTRREDELAGQPIPDQPAGALPVQAGSMGAGF